MPGKKITRLRDMLADAAAKATAAIGTEDETFARNRLEAIAAELKDEEARRAKFGKHPRAPSTWRKTEVGKAAVSRRRREKSATAERLVGGKRPKNFVAPDLGIEAGMTAAEIAVEGVREDFVVLKRGAPEPLTEKEFENARDIVATVTENSDFGKPKLTADGSFIDLSRERWLAEAFPSLTEERRVKCARFLSGMATLAAEKPNDAAPTGGTVIEMALAMAGMTYVEFENARQADARFDGAQAAIKAARKRCIMDRLEETLQNRALFGQNEETVDRFGQRHEAKRIDNNLAFNLLKYGHEQYLKQNIEDKAKTTAMTLMIAQGHYPDAPRVKEPKQAEVIDVR